MKTHPLILALAAAAVLVPCAKAGLPAPFHTLYGTVRMQDGRPLLNGEGEVRLLKADSSVAVRNTTSNGLAAGLNYILRIPMDSGVDAALYKPSAFRKLMPFSIRVVIGSTTYVPIQMTAGSWAAGRPAEQMRLDITLGIDSDHDGLPDAWEQFFINANRTDSITSLAQVTPGGDLDGDGLSNLAEFAAGTNPISTADKPTLRLTDLADNSARLEFRAQRGRTYTIEGSNDLLNWSRQPLSDTPALGAQYDHHIATDTVDTSVYAPHSALNKKFFYRLHAE